MSSTSNNPLQFVCVVWRGQIGEAYVEIPNLAVKLVWCKRIPFFFFFWPYNFLEYVFSLIELYLLAFGLVQFELMALCSPVSE